MKFSIVTVISTLSAAQAWVSPSAGSARTSTSLNAKLLYGSSTGNTEAIADFISEATGIDAEDIADAENDAITAETSLIVGAPTWHTGADDQRSGTGWDDWLYENLGDIDMSGKKVAIFGCGDQASYAEYYCDAAEELHSKFTEAGAKVYGLTSTEGYDHDESKAEIEEGKFCGLMCDQDNQDDLTEDRVKAWVAQLTAEEFF